MVEVDAIGDDGDVEVAFVGYGVGVGFANDGECIEDGESFVFGGAEHFEFVVENVAPESAAVVHTAFGVHGEGVLEVHDFGVFGAGYEVHGADHLVVYDIGLDFAFERTVGVAGAGCLPIADLQGAGGEPVAHDVAVAYDAVEVHNTDVGAIGAQG